jgi:hypothetical protein
MLLIVFEPFGGGEFQQAVDGAGRALSRLGKPLGCPSGGGSQRIAFVQGFERGNQGLQAADCCSADRFSSGKISWLTAFDKFVAAARAFKRSATPFSPK